MRVSIKKNWYGKPILFIQNRMSAYTYIDNNGVKSLTRVIFVEDYSYNGSIKKETVKVHIDSVVPQVVEAYLKNLFVVFQDPVTGYLVKMYLDKVIGYIYKLSTNKQIYSHESDFEGIVFRGITKCQSYFKLSHLLDQSNYVNYYLKQDLLNLDNYLNPDTIQNPVEYLLNNVVYGVEPRLSESELSGNNYIDKSRNKHLGYYIVNGVVYYIELSVKKVLIQYSDKTHILYFEDIDYKKLQKALCFSRFLYDCKDRLGIFSSDITKFKELSLEIYKHLYPQSTD